MTEKKTTPEHNETIHMTFVEHYEEHEKRTESPLFKLTKKHMHEDSREGGTICQS